MYAKGTQVQVNGLEKNCVQPNTHTNSLNNMKLVSPLHFKQFFLPYRIFKCIEFSTILSAILMVTCLCD